jgi:hypothetical protein
VYFANVTQRFSDQQQNGYEGNKAPYDIQNAIQSLHGHQAHNPEE